MSTPRDCWWCDVSASLPYPTLRAGAAHYLNHLPVIHEAIGGGTGAAADASASFQGSGGVLFQFEADPPTVTMQVCQNAFQDVGYVVRIGPGSASWLMSAHKLLIPSKSRDVSREVGVRVGSKLKCISTILLKLGPGRSHDSKTPHFWKTVVWVGLPLEWIRQAGTLGIADPCHD